MKSQAFAILRYISLLQRNTHRFFDLALEQNQIGSGQQFFLLRVFEHDGISMLDLAKLGGFDKATVTRAVQKLVEEGYVYTVLDEQDKRVRRVHLTEAARPVVERVYRVRDGWVEMLMQGLGPDEQARLLEALRVMVSHSSEALQSLHETTKGEPNDAE